MFISIIIPVYNDQAGLNRALKNIQSQSMSATCFEVIVIDNNSNPAMKPCLEISMPFKIYPYSKPGSYAARNYGVQKSKGDILVFLDADCYPSPQWLEIGTTELLKDNNSIIGGEVLFEKSPKPTAIEQYQYITGFFQQENITKKEFSVTANLFIATWVFNRVGPFNETLFSGGDLEWCWRARNTGFKIKFSSKAVVYTAARKSLRKAIIQARRVSGGRKQLYQLKILSTENKQKIAPHRNPFQAIRFIFSQTQIPCSSRIKIFGVAILLKLIQLAEKARLFYGAKAERR